MNRRIRKILECEDLKRVSDYTGKEFEHGEILKALLDAQYTLLNHTFEKSHAEKLHYEDLYNYFKMAGTEYELKGDDVYVRFMNRLNTLKGQINAFLVGAIGEKRVASSLKLLEMDGARVIHNIELVNTSGERCEIDTIVINSSGIYVLEVKNYGSAITITNEGIVHENGFSKYGYPLQVKMNEKELLIRETIINAGISQKICMENLFVMADIKTAVNDEYKLIKICNTGNLIPLLRSSRNQCLDNETINQIATALLEAHKPMKYGYTCINFAELVEDYAYLISLIESKSEFLYSDCNSMDDLIEDSVEEPRNLMLIKYILSALCGAAITSAGFIVAGVLF